MTRCILRVILSIIGQALQSTGRQSNKSWLQKQRTSEKVCPFFFLGSSYRQITSRVLNLAQIQLDLQNC